MSATVVAVSRSPTHSFSKANELGILLVVGRGVDGDAHAGETVKTDRAWLAIQPSPTSGRFI